MSKVVKAVRKVFKKVVKVVKKIAPIALAVGALVFTGGAALGLAPMAGGWGAAASAVTAKLGATGVLGSAMTGAITQAGYGALAGGVLSSVTGGKFSDGMRTGAIGGAVTGGLLGAAGIGTDPLAGKLGGQQGGALKTMPVPEQTIGVGTPMGADGGLAAGVPTPTSGPSSFLPTTPGTAGGAAGRLGGLLGKGGWIERNGTLAGNVIGGLGQGLMGAAEADAIRQGQKDRFAQIEKNYGDVDPGAYYTQAAPGESQQSPTERFDPSTYGQWEYKYDAKQGRIVRAPVG